MNSFRPIALAPILFALSAGCVSQGVDPEGIDEETGTASEAVTSLQSPLKSALSTNLCLDVDHSSTASGTRVQIWGCNGTAAQQWNYTSAGELRSALDSSLCLDVSGASTASGTKVQIWGCNGTAAQRWVSSPSGELRSALASNLCLDVSGGSTAWGTSVQIWGCNGTAAQRWTANSPSPDQWMENLASVIGNKPLNKLVIPATHDSGTYGLIPVSARPSNDLFGPDVENEIIKVGALVGVTDGWARAQGRDIGQQLADGIRSLDFRPCVEKDSTLRICHGLYGPRLDQMLDAVAAFAASHPKEILLLSFSNYSQNALGDMSDYNVFRVHSLIQQKLGSRLFNHAAISPTTTLNTLWNTQPGRSVIVTSDRPDTLFWSSSRWTGSWHGDVWDIVQKKKDLDGDLNSYRNESKLFGLSAAATENADAIGLSAVMPSYPHTLEDMADAVNPVMMSWLLNDWGRPLGPSSQLSDALRVNVVSVDHYHKTCLLPAVWWLNGAPAVSFAGCNVVSSTWDSSANHWTLGSSVWSTWRGAKACPEGFRDDGLYCAKPAAYSRGAGYLDQSACWADHGSEYCEACGWLYFLKCQDGFQAAGCNICSPVCPADMTDIGASCQK